MNFVDNNTVTSAINFAVEHGVIVDGRFSRSCNIRDLKRFTNMIRGATDDPSGILLSNSLDTGTQVGEGGSSVRMESGANNNVSIDEVYVEDDEDYDGLGDPLDIALSRLDVLVGNVDGGSFGLDGGACFDNLCSYILPSYSLKCQTVSELTDSTRESLASSTRFKVAYKVFGKDNPRNHVIPVHANTIDNAVRLFPASPVFGEESIIGVTSASKFFEKNGRFHGIRFYADDNANIDMSDVAFGGDSAARFQSRGHPSGSSGHQTVPRPPGSVVDEEQRSGTANVNGGVTRSKRRVIKARGGHDAVFNDYRSYGTVGTTMFNNIEEMYLNTISREYAQEIMEELFSAWGLPTGESSTMQYAEDLLWAFLVARTASDKADYNVEYDIPTKSGTVLADFSKFSVLLADKYGLTRRNFARGVANDLRSYINREENQFLKSRCAHRVGADPQYGSLCFDGSTGCTGVTPSEAMFVRLLESRNLYEKDDVLAQGASDRLMRGTHGGVRSAV